MTIEELSYVRERLGLSSKDFAALLGSTINTVSRWEASGTPIRADPFRRQLCTALHTALQEASIEDVELLRKKLKLSFVTYGNLYALKLVLEFIYPEKVK